MSWALTPYVIVALRYDGVSSLFLVRTVSSWRNHDVDGWASEKLKVFSGPCCRCLLVDGNGPCCHRGRHSFRAAVPTQTGEHDSDERLRRPEADVNTRDNISGKSGTGPRCPLLSLRAAVILLGGLVAGVAAGTLTYLGVHDLPAAVLAGIPTCAGAIKFLDYLIA